MYLGAIIINELKRGFILARRYFLQSIINLVVFYVLIMGILLGINTFIPGLGANQLSQNLLVVLVWLYTFISLTVISTEIEEDSKCGTFEQLYLSPVNIICILLARCFSSLILFTVFVAVLALAAAWSWHLVLVFHWLMILVLIFISLGILGLGFILGGLTLIFKKVGLLVSVILMLLMGAAFVPLAQLPWGIRLLLKMIPLVNGVELLKALSWPQFTGTFWFSRHLILLVVSSWLFFFFGILVFTWLEKIARQKGLIGAY